MKIQQITGRLAVAASLLCAGTAFAAGPTNAEYYPFAEIMAMKMMDKNRDGMVSKKEFLDMMSMAWEMNAKKMGATGGMLTVQQFQELLMYMKAGG